MSCPHCGATLENYSYIEGGWCPKCKEWFPTDLIREAEEAEADYDDDDYFVQDEDAEWEAHQEEHRQEEEEEARKAWEEENK